MNELGSIARSTVHSLNNVVGVLYAAADYLEPPASEASLDRARKAVERACASAQALSAALSLLALESGDVVVAAARHPTTLETDELTRIFDTVQAVCGAHTPSPGQLQLSAPLLIDRDTLQSVLVCAGAALRHDAGTGMPLHCTWAAPAGAAAARATGQIFEIHEVEPRTAAYGHKVSASRHLCALALAHATPLLASLGVDIDTATPGAIRVGLRPVVAA